MPSKTKKTETPEDLAGGPAPEVVTVAVADVVQHNQLLTALATALSHLLENGRGVVISLQGQLNIVFKDEIGNISLSPVTSNDQLAPGQLVSINQPTEQVDGETHQFDWKHNTESQLPVETGDESLAMEGE